MTTLDDVRDTLADDTARNRWIGIWIGVLAVLLALGGWGGGNAALDAQRLNVDAANAWAWYQAKNIRRTDLTLAVDQITLLLRSTPSPTDELIKGVHSREAEWGDLAARLADDETTDGMVQLMARARSIEKARDAALKADSFFGLAMAALQIAVVLASVAIVLGRAMLPLWGSGLAGALGTMLMVHGFWG